MADNIIKVYQNNTKNVNCIVGGISLTGYTPYLTVKKHTSDPSILLSLIGSVSDPSVATFNISSTDSSLSVGDYVYDITVEADTSIYTVLKDVFIVLDGVRY